MTLSKDPSLLKNSTVIAVISFLSSVIGFARDIVIAAFFGATAGLDAFLVSYRLANFMRGLYAEGSFAQVFVPVISSHHETQGAKDNLQFMGKILGTLSAALLLLMVVMELFSPLIVLLFAPGFWQDPIRFAMAEHMLWLTIPYLSLIPIAAFFSAILNTRHSFAVSSFTPVLFNLVMIISVFFLAKYFKIGEQALALGIFFAGILQLIVQIPFLRRYSLLPKFQWGWQDKEVCLFFKRLIPLMLGASVTQIGLLITTFFASFLTVGSISWLFYADRVAFFPLGILSVALATAVLPVMATAAHRKDTDHFNAALDWALRLLLILGLPATLGLIVLAGPLTVCFFKHGEFSLLDVLMTQNCIQAFAVGLPALMAIKLLTSAFYAQHKSKFPIAVAILSLFCQIVLSLLLMTWSGVGLALATSLSAMINAILLLGILLRYRLFIPVNGWSSLILKLLFANVAMVTVLLNFVPTLPLWLEWSVYQKISHLLFYLVVALLVYFGGLWLSGMRHHHIQIKTLSRVL